MSTSEKKDGVLGRRARSALGCMMLIPTSLAWPSSAQACAGVPPIGESILVKHEQALIVWDESRHIEHFVRTAAFDGSARSFGFLVPTPGRPILAEVDESLMLDLHVITAPEDAYLNDPRLDPSLSLVGYYLQRGRAQPVAAAAPVHVLEETLVAGLDATVVAASDAEALSAWLLTRGFAQREDLKRWLANYVAKGWYVTAFRYERPANRPHPVDAPHEPQQRYIMRNVETGEWETILLTSKAVRISFAANEPVYPYLEPADVPDVPHRTLDLFLVASQRMEGTLIDAGSRPWNADVVFASDRVDEHTFDFDDADRTFAQRLGIEVPRHAWITHYVDHASKRVASDLVFRPSASAKEVHPQPRVSHVRTPVPVPYELLPLGVAGAWWWHRRARKRRGSAVAD